MELRQLAVVVAVAEEGGFTAAAHRLRTVQSTVSTVVRALERDLGTPLFHRTTHRVALTPAGAAFLPAARAALAAAERARAAVSPVTGRLRLGVCPGLLVDLHCVLTTLRQLHPGLVIEVRQAPADHARRMVTESLVDAVLTVAPDCAAGSGANANFPADGTAAAAALASLESATAATRLRTPSAVTPAGSAPTDTPPAATPAASTQTGTPPAATPADSTQVGTPPATTPLPPEELVLVTAPGGSRSAPADLAGLPLVGFPPGWAIRAAVDRAFPGRQVALEVDDLAVATGLVRAGLAAGVLPASVAARFPGLTVRRFDRPPSWQLAVLHRTDVPAAVAALLAQLG